MRNKVNNLKKYAKQRYYSNLDERLSSSRFENPKQYWKYLRSLVNNNTSINSIPVLKTLNNDLETFHYTDEDKANCLNEYFTSISTLDDSNATLPNFVHKTLNTLSTIQISVADVESIIGTLDINKAIGPDQISHKLLKATKHSISKPLCRIFNKSLDQETFPQSWKQSIIMPLFKKGDKSCVSNYRPISLLSCVGKLMERCVYKYMCNFFVSNDIIYQKQSGFLKGHSTVHQLIDIYHQVVSSLDSNQNTCMVFCDISKAFDRVWHKGLLFKLQQNGINGCLLNWIKSYLSNRQQAVFVGTAKSKLMNVKAGVPQGSVLGPLLFLIYVNDISENLLSISRLFADDTSLACSAAAVQDIQGILNHDLLMISYWAKQWLVTFSPQKTVAMIFSAKTVPSPNLFFDNVQISFVEHHKHVGLTLSVNGKWREHIRQLTVSASKILGMMRAVKFKISRNSLNQLYISFLRPLLEYASVVWDNCTFSERDSLEKIQNEAARIVTGLTRSTSLINLYTEIGWLSLSDRRKYQKLILTFKIINGQAPDFLCQLFPSTVGNSTVYSFRNSLDIETLARRTEIFAKSFIPSAISLWNNLPMETKSLQSLSMFKSTILRQFPVSVVPKYFGVGDRKFSVFQARLRNNCSDLKSDLHKNHISESNLCHCGYYVEDAEHYFFHCLSYTNQRLMLFRKLRKYHPLNLNLLLFGSDNLSLNDNIEIVYSVQEFIKNSGRFD